MLKPAALLFVAAFGLTLLVLFGVSRANIACTSDSQVCHHVYKDGSCCLQITSIPELIAHDTTSGQVPNWVQLAGGVKCGVTWPKRFFINCFYPNGEACGATGDSGL